MVQYKVQIKFVLVAHTLITLSLFQVGSYSYDMSRMEFGVSTLGYIQKTQSIILDYAINIKKLKPNDQIFDSGALGNFSLAGFEMVNESIQTLTKLNNTLALI